MSIDFQVVGIESMGEWDFIGSDNNEYTHCFHRYPATMIPHLARKLISMYGGPGMSLLDPYCGTGTSLVEARLAGMKSFGFDLNHTARKISIVKTNNYDITKLDNFIKKITNEIFDLELMELTESLTPDGFSLKTIRSWYPDQTIKEILTIIEYLKKFSFNEKINDFALITLSDCLRDVSYQRNNEFKLYRIPLEERALFYVDIKPLYIKKLIRNFNGVVNNQEKLSNKEFLTNTNSKISSKNSVIIKDLKYFQKVDLVVTSPPYGDSISTVAYAQFSWLTNMWFGFDQRTSNALDRDLMGGIVSDKIDLTGCDIIDEAISKIAQIDSKRAREIYSFYRDYKLSIKHIAQKIKPLGYSCYVVGNRTVRGEYLRTDIFTKELFEKYDFEYIGTEIRSLTNTRMPGKISPSGKKGITAPTMKNEYIVICRKLA